MTAANSDRPYEPSLIDRFNDWVEGLPLRAWAFYLLTAVVLILVQILFLWFDGGLAARELLPIIIFNGLATPFLLGLIQLLDNQAVTALDSMRPSLEMSEPEYEELRYKISNMPARGSLISGLTLLVVVITMEQLGGVPTRYAALESLPLFSVIFQIIDKSSAFMYGVITFHTIWQLRLVRAVTSDYMRVNLFNLAPTQAFSRLTASTAIGLVAGMFAWMLLNPDLLANPVSVAFSAGFTALGLAVFVWPLYGAHRRMEMEKTRVLGEIDILFEQVFSQFHQHLREGNYGAADKLNGTIASLEIQHKRISDVPTWPWRPETARIVLTAIALPLTLMILQTFVVQVLNR